MKDEQFARIVSRRMNELGLSRSDIATHMSVSEESVRRWVNGKAHPRFETVPRFAALLRVPISALHGANQDAKATVVTIEAGGHAQSVVVRSGDEVTIRIE